MTKSTHIKDMNYLTFKYKDKKYELNSPLKVPVHWANGTFFSGQNEIGIFAYVKGSKKNFKDVKAEFKELLAEDLDTYWLAYVDTDSNAQVSRKAQELKKLMTRKIRQATMN